MALEIPSLFTGNGHETESDIIAAFHMHRPMSMQQATVHGEKEEEDAAAELLRSGVCC